jgi:argininosuccinate synthase
VSRTAVVAFSGGLDTSCIVSWLLEDYAFDRVIAVLVDVGQAFDIDASIERGEAAGAADVLLVDRKEAFADEQVAKALKANALYEGRYPLVSALSRPVIAAAVAEVAIELDADAVVHGCTGKGNDQLRFELSFRANYPGVEVIAPLRDTVWTRDEEIEYAIAKGIPVAQTAASPYSIDENLFGRSIECGVLEDPWQAPPEEPYELTADPQEAPAPEEVEVEFEAGLPVAIDGVSLPLHELVAELSAKAGAYGVGRIDMVENRAVGIKSREVYEAPAAIALIEAHRSLEDLVLTKAELRIKRQLEVAWTELVYEGQWYNPARVAIDAFVDTTQALVDGDVRLLLQAGSATVVGRRSPNALYAETLASYAPGETFPHEAAAGFVRIASLEAELAAARHRQIAAAT